MPPDQRRSSAFAIPLAIAFVKPQQLSRDGGWWCAYVCAYVCMRMCVRMRAHFLTAVRAAEDTYCTSVRSHAVKHGNDDLEIWSGARDRHTACPAPILDRGRARRPTDDDLSCTFTSVSLLRYVGREPGYLTSAADMPQPQGQARSSERRKRWPGALPRGVVTCPVREPGHVFLHAPSQQKRTAVDSARQDAARLSYPL